MKTVILDTNVTLRFLLADDPQQSPKAKELFARAEEGQLRLRLSHLAVAELVWVLTSFFNFTRLAVGTTLRGLLLHKGVAIDDEELVLAALDRFTRIAVDFPDCYAAAWAARDGIPVATYDRDFRKFPDVKGLTPDEILKGK